MSESKNNIVLYTAGTPNGQKASITLEELGLKYDVHHIDISKNEQKEEWFLKINPNGRIPAMVDNGNSGKRIFESGSMMLYLCQKYDPEGRLCYPFDSDQYWEVVEWLFWMNSGLGPMQGQANHFFRYAPEKIKYGIDRYQTETKRLYEVLDQRLAAQVKQSQTAAGTSVAGRDGSGSKGPWLVGSKMTIADIACFSWVNWAEWAGVDVAPFKSLKEWQDRINTREAVQKGLNIPEKFEMKEKMKTKEGEREYEKYHSSWVMKGQESDQKKHS